MSAAPLLSVRELKVHFPLRAGGILRPRQVTLKAVDGVSFDLAAGEALGIVGESGCGKSTLARAVLKLIPPTAGRIVWLGQDLTHLDDGAMRPHRRDIQVVFQDPLASLDPRMTIGDIIAEPLRSLRPELAKSEVRDRVRAILQTVGLTPEMINRYPHEFSGGQSQRIGIARAMVVEPRLIICDEPVSALDVSIQAQIINLLQRLQRDFGLALIFISHDLSIVRHVSRRVMVLYLGKVMELADRDDLCAAPRHPYTKALIAAVPLPDPDRERQKPRLTLAGDLPSPIDPPSGCPFRTRCPQADELCAHQMPALDDDNGHFTACHHWRE